MHLPRCLAPSPCTLSLGFAGGEGMQGTSRTALASPPLAIGSRLTACGSRLKEQRHASVEIDLLVLDAVQALDDRELDRGAQRDVRSHGEEKARGDVEDAAARVRILLAREVDLVAAG